MGFSGFPEAEKSGVKHLKGLATRSFYSLFLPILRATPAKLAEINQTRRCMNIPFLTWYMAGCFLPDYLGNAHQAARLGELENPGIALEKSVFYPNLLYTWKNHSLHVLEYV